MSALLRRAGVVVALVLLAAGAGIIAVSRASVSASESGSVASAPFTPKASEIPSALSRRFSLFRQPATKHPSRYRTSMSPADASTLGGANPAMARVARTPSGAVAVMPGDRGVCLRIPLGDPRLPDGYALGCTPIRDAVTGHAIMVLGGEDGAPLQIVGLVPDDVSAVDVVKADGTSRRADLTGNVWSAAVRDADRVEFQGADGRTVLDTIHLP